ncbi:hypothetical protein BAUCODRAFT_20857 [Baudoinia panamericana UAMH 10762]|uniref:Uncharacterized protein n=1 Tax=Baudoinia panamericana (strain UAMH 10762) TaxID=717646 RepID=M2MV62_BAUPA|nr:uncharacterized protein BAUCODRAFT_20857 [Baudoinia panamericana UAMH 10762]EMD00842.1 hypothetical protein BAUCODRAFT_20857 [Baudoinia panamericana UAMH 10762]
MDPAGLLISVATILIVLDELTESYGSANNTLALIKSQVKVLEAGTQRIQEWLWYTDPASKSELMESLGDAVSTVNAALQRLQEEIEAITRTGPRTAKLLGKAGSDQWVKTKFVYSEGRMRRHLTDVRECASLMSFCLTVCQLPFGTAAQREVQELSRGARSLQRVQTSSRHDRRSVIQQESSEQPSEPQSEDYRNFMASVMSAEADLPDDETPQPSRQNTAESTSAITLANLRVVPTNGAANTSEPDSPSEVSFDELEEPLASPVDPDPELDRSVGNNINEAAPQPWHDAGLESGTKALTLTSSHQAQTTTALTHTPVPVGVAYSTPSVIRRKPVSGPSAPGPVATPSSSQKQAQQAISIGLSSGSRNSRASTALTRNRMSTLMLMEKMSPLAQSLQSLDSSDYLNVELDQVPIQPYHDNPPAYVAALPSSSTTPAPRAVRRDTARSSLVNPFSPRIIKLVVENRLEELRNHLINAGNVNEVDTRTGRTAIMEAACHRRWDACRLLLQAGALLHLKDSEGNSALHLAARKGDAEICQMLVDAGAHVDDCNAAGQQPLQLAVAGGHTDTVLTLVNAVPLRKANEEPLIAAFLETVRLGDTPTAQALLAKGVKTKKMKDPWRMTAYAAQGGSLPMLELVLNEKASLKDRSPQGYTPLHFAALHDRQPMVERLLSLKASWKAQTKKTEETALHMAAAAGHTFTAIALASHKDASVTMKDADSQEPIHHAVRKGDLRLTAKLLEKGAKLKESNKYGWKPIHLAAAYGHAALVAECITRGISIEEKLATPSFKPEKRTNQAARRGYWAEIRWPHSGSRPLHLALEFGHDDVAHMLIAGGAKLEESDTRGWRPLHMAAWSCRPDMVELLLSKGVAADARTVDGHTALSLGFREYGLTADGPQRGRIHEMLSMALARSKKSVLRKLSSGITSPGAAESKTAYQRNLAWHKAQLAESLYHSKALNDGEGELDDESLDDSEIGVAISDDLGSVGDQQDLYDAHAGSSQVAIAK